MEKALINPPIWSVAPFILMLVSIAIIPLVFHKWWKKHINQAIISAVWSIPIMCYILIVNPHEVLNMLCDYFSFIVLLGSLYIISGGIHIKGSLAGTPLINTFVLAIGAILANFIGTTGASMLLIRPLIRANRHRHDKVHIIIFFIFIVSNCGGLLTPLGDPPLFLGFLKGVPFLWTFRLWTQWLFVCGVTLIVFNFIDQWRFNREDMATRGSQVRPEGGLTALTEGLVEDVTPLKPLGIEGAVNFLFLGGVVLAILLSGYLHWQFGVKEAFMILMTAFSLALTKKHIRKSQVRPEGGLTALTEGNEFTFSPIIEVAVLFFGIFITMIPALMILNARGHELGLTQPWHFFWATGLLSSFLDNAPTYLAMTSAAGGLVDVPLSASYLKDLIATGNPGVTILSAISCGAVFMGANTYIGNGPNFMVKAIAEESHIKMPSFFGYMIYSALILIPIFILTTVIFFT